MQVEVFYANAKDQALIKVEVSFGTTAIEAVQASGILERFEELRLGELKLGIYSQKVTHETVLSAQDRVEIYRPLLIDPKEKRRMRAKRQRR